MANHTWRYTNGDDLPDLREWCAAHGSMDPVPVLPQVGVLVDDCLAVFLYQTDSSLCLIDSIVSRPGTPPFIVKDALLFGIAQLKAVAKDMGYTRVLGLADRASIASLCATLGGTPRAHITVFDGSL